MRENESRGSGGLLITAFAIGALYLMTNTCGFQMSTGTRRNSKSCGEIYRELHTESQDALKRLKDGYEGLVKKMDIPKSPMTGSTPRH